MKLRKKVRRRLVPINKNEKINIDSEISFNGKKVGKVLIDTPFPFALIKLFDPDFSEFSSQELLADNQKIKLIKPSFLSS